jgi:hypothetical protein
MSGDRKAPIGAIWVLCALAWGAFLARVVVPAARNPNTDGFAAYYTEARVLLEDHRDLPRVYDDAWFQQRIDRFFGAHVLDLIHAQPPAMSLILAPLAWLPPAPARALWIAASVLLWLAGLALLIDGLRLGASGVGRIPPLVPLSAIATIYTPLADNLRRGQSYTLLFFLLAAALRALLRPPQRRPWLGGVPLGLMLWLKSAGAWLWPLLAVARRKRALLAAAATVVAGAVLASPLTGWAVWRIFVLDYRWLRAQRTFSVTAYQTVTSLTRHLCVLDSVWNPAPVVDLPRLASALSLLITAAIFVESARVGRLGSAAVEDRALTLGLFVAPMAALSPLAEGYHYVLTFPAIVIAGWWFLRAPAAAPRLWSLLACVALICVPQAVYGSPRLGRGWLALLAYPRVYGALGLWAWLRRALRRRADEPSRPDTAPATEPPLRAAARADPPARPAAGHPSVSSGTRPAGSARRR